MTDNIIQLKLYIDGKEARTSLKTVEEDIKTLASSFEGAEKEKTLTQKKYSAERALIGRKETNLAIAEAEIRKEAFVSSMNFIRSSVGANTIFGKAASVANATMSTYEAAAKALTAGPILGPILAGIITALGLANVSKILSVEPPQMKGFARGGVVVGEKGPEIIAPMQDYASGQALLIRQTVTEARRALASTGYMQAAGDSKALITEIQKLNAAFESYSGRPITITKEAVGKIVSQGNSQLRKSRV